MTKAAGKKAQYNGQRGHGDKNGGETRYRRRAKSMQLDWQGGAHRARIHRYNRPRPTSRRTRARSEKFNRRGRMQADVRVGCVHMGYSGPIGRIVKGNFCVEKTWFCSEMRGVTLGLLNFFTLVLVYCHGCTKVFVIIAHGIKVIVNRNPLIIFQHFVILLLLLFCLSWIWLELWKWFFFGIK